MRVVFDGVGRRPDHPAVSLRHLEIRTLWRTAPSALLEPRVAETAVSQNPCLRSALCAPRSCRRRLRRDNPLSMWEDGSLEHLIGDWRALSAAALQGKCWHARSVFSQTLPPLSASLRAEKPPPGTAALAGEKHCASTRLCACFSDAVRSPEGFSSRGSGRPQVPS